MTEFSKTYGKRVEALAEALRASGAATGLSGPFATVVCDGCGKAERVERATGWTSKHSAKAGWTDLCRRCSQ